MKDGLIGLFTICIFVALFVVVLHGLSQAITYIYTRTRKSQDRPLDDALPDDYEWYEDVDTTNVKDDTHDNRSN